MSKYKGYGQKGPPVYRNGDAYVARAFVCIQATQHGDYYDHRYGIFLVSNGRRPYHRVCSAGNLPDAIASCNKYARLKWVEESSLWKRLFRAGRWEKK